LIRAVPAKNAEIAADCEICPLPDRTARTSAVRQSVLRLHQDLRPCLYRSRCLFPCGQLKLLDCYPPDKSSNTFAMGAHRHAMACVVILLSALMRSCSTVIRSQRLHRGPAPPCCRGLDSVLFTQQAGRREIEKLSCSSHTSKCQRSAPPGIAALAAGPIVSPPMRRRASPAVRFR